MKVQVVFNKQKNTILNIDFCAGAIHDFQLLKDSKINFSDSTKVLVDKGYQGIAKLIQKDNTTPKEYAKMKDEYAFELQKKDKFSEGLEKGIQKCLEKGKKAEKIEIAKNLLDVLDIETIALKTGLTKEEIG